MNNAASATCPADFRSSAIILDSGRYATTDQRRRFAAQTGEIMRQWCSRWCAVASEAEARAKTTPEGEDIARMLGARRVWCWPRPSAPSFSAGAA